MIDEMRQDPAGLRDVSGGMLAFLPVLDELFKLVPADPLGPSETMRGKVGTPRRCDMRIPTVLAIIVGRKG
jgi:hypothetical protein